MRTPIRILFIATLLAIPLPASAACSATPLTCARNAESYYAPKGSAQCADGGYYCKTISQTAPKAPTPTPPSKPAVAPTSTAPAKTATTALALGARGSGVSALQERLVTLGYMEAGSATGYFGPLTRTALMRFQSDRGLEAVGYVGPQTRVALAEDRGATPPAQPASSATLVETLLAQVRLLQERIAALTNPANTPAPPPSSGGGGGGGTPFTPQSCDFNGQRVAHGTGVTAYQAPTAPTCTSEMRTCADGTLSGSFTYASCTATPPAPGQTTCTWNSQTISSGTSVTAYQASTVPFGTPCVSQQRTCTNGVLSGTYTNTACTPALAASCTFNSQSVAHGASVTGYQAATVPYGSTCVSQTRTCTNGVLSGSYTNATCSVQGALGCQWNGQTVANGQSVTAYQSSTVPYGTQCVSQQRTCTSGTLSGTYLQSACSVAAAASCTLAGVTVAHNASATFYSAATVAYGQSCTAVALSRTCTNGTLSGSSSYSYAACTPAAQTTFPQSVVIPARNVYSPELVRINGQLKMYFGGWTQANQINDNIYIADCDASGTTCTGVRSVMNPTQYNMVHTNDPSIVLVPASGSTPAYFIMYLTGLRTGGYANISDTHIYYSTSWASDGENWSAPQILLSGYWLPSAVRKPDGTIELFAYGLPGTPHPFLTKFSLGNGGTTPTEIGQVGMIDAQGVLAPESNAYVRYNASLGFYQILGESMPADGHSALDYLTSIDGLSWGLQKRNIAVPDSGQFRIGTPATDPDNIFKLYFGSTPNTDSMDMKIRTTEWRP